MNLIPAAAAKLLQSCLTLCNPIDGSPPGSSVPGILQARILKWVAISFSSAWKWKVKVKSLSRVRLCATLWTTAQQAPLSLGFSRQEYWSGVPSELPQIGEGIVLLLVVFIWHSYHTMPCFLFFIYNFSTNNSLFEHRILDTLTVKNPTFPWNYTTTVQVRQQSQDSKSGWLDFVWACSSLSFWFL